MSAKVSRPAIKHATLSREFVAYEPHSSPDGMRVLMADEAEIYERARCQILAYYRSCGYRLVDPPIVDSIESLDAAATSELQQKTVRLMDPEDARPLGIRADITPQIARLDARQMDHTIPQRYSYCGCILHGKRDHVGAWRNPYQIGAELFGADSLNSDLEIIELAVETCRMMAYSDLVLDLGHLGVFDILFESSRLHSSLRQPLFALMQHKSISAVNDFFDQYSTSAEIRDLFINAVHLYGGRDIVDRAAKLFGSVEGIDKILHYLSTVIDALQSWKDIGQISVDLINSNSYSYERGIVFVLYSPQSRHELIRGGRYNDIGDSFGRPRSAVGFSGYMHELTARQEKQSQECIYAPFGYDDAELMRAIADLRKQGRAVVRGLLVQHNESRLDCECELVKVEQKWQVRPSTAHR